MSFKVSYNKKYYYKKHALPSKHSERKHACFDSTIHNKFFKIEISWHNTVSRYRPKWKLTQQLLIKERSISSVKYVTTHVIKRVIWKHILNQFMKEKSHSNVIFATTAVLKRVPWKHMCQWSMKRKNLSNVTFVTTAVL